MRAHVLREPAPLLRARLALEERFEPEPGGDVSSSGVVEACERFHSESSALASCEDPEVVHGLRVSIRRLRVGLRLFESSPSNARRATLARDLRWFFRALGKLRELQVFQATCQQRLVKGTPGASAFEQRLQRQIADQRRVVLRLVSSARYRRLVRGLATFMASDLGMHARHGLVRRLRQRRRRTLAALRAAIKAPEGVHTARKELKKLRYTCEFSQQKFEEKDVRRYLKGMKQLQEELGEVVDLSVWQELVGETCRARGLRDRLVAQFARERELCLSACELHAHRFAKMKPFWND